MKSWVHFPASHEPGHEIYICSAAGQWDRVTLECRDPAAVLSRFLSLCYWELAKNWIPTSSVKGTVGAIGWLWASDWPLVLDWVPSINSKFKKGD
ncbi:cytochrome b-c1 complex subunit 10-like [Rattus norvegicus]|uniref:cytochrome b-c1 complex subunit 10-like n=1 Tax=Rattus norvegicus TaxID=10116 RepID=UPI0019171349|nr:cytochrome b-c1 complex subunit 10-like [Rattus norvegicus]